jgi:4-hydroxy-tetrahydrodipicolinate synthase
VRFFIKLAERCPNFQFAKLENVLPGERSQQIVSQSNGKVKVLYGWGGLRLFDGLAHGASGTMPGPALLDVYAQVLRLYGDGSIDEAKALFYRMMPFLVFALEHIELFIQMEKRLLVKRGVIPYAAMREPTLHLDEQYTELSEDLTSLMVKLVNELQRVGKS